MKDREITFWKLLFLLLTFRQIAIVITLAEAESPAQSSKSKQQLAIENMSDRLRQKKTHVISILVIFIYLFQKAWNREQQCTQSKFKTKIWIVLMKCKEQYNEQLWWLKNVKIRTPFTVMIYSLFTSGLKEYRWAGHKVGTRHWFWSHWKKSGTFADEAEIMEVYSRSTDGAWKNSSKRTKSHLIISSWSKTQRWLVTTNFLFFLQKKIRWLQWYFFT